jgi:hypothetical protein
MLERYRERLAFVEAKLAEFENENSSRKRMFVSQMVQTGSEADGGSSDGSPCLSHTMHPGKPGDEIVLPTHTAESNAELNSNEISPPPPPEEVTPLLPSDDASEYLAVSNGRREVQQGPGESHRTWGSLEQGLSSCVFMVGVGVCAIVIQTLLKRLAGKKA